MTRAAAAGLALALACGAAVPVRATVAASAPERPDPKTIYLFYVHGRIVQEQGRHAVSPRYGPYEYDAIVNALAAPGIAVIGEVRTKGTDPAAYAKTIAAQVGRLLAAGVPPEHVTVVGASMGGYIALLVSSAVEDPGVGYAVLGICDEETIPQFRGRVHGAILSIYERSDTTEGSCALLFAGTGGISRHEEIRLDTGLEHGFLFRPLPVWVDPVLQWARTRTLPPPAPGRVRTGS